MATWLHALNRGNNSASSRCNNSINENTNTNINNCINTVANGRYAVLTLLATCCSRARATLE